MQDNFIEGLKYTFYCLLFLLSLIAISCKSSPIIPYISQFQSPIVKVTVRDSVITDGDTLYVTLKASDPKRLNGTFDFGDSSLIYFSNIMNIDTTIKHVYSKVGWYLLKANFSNDDTTLAASATVIVNKYFSMDLKVGMSWKYYYEYYFFYPAYGETESHKGVHEWKIISLSVADQDTTFDFEETRNDTVYSEGYNSQGYFDTTYQDKKTSQFEVIQSYSKTTFNIPLLESVEIFIIPNNQFVDSYPYSTQMNGSAAFDENGLIHYYRGSQGGLLSFHESLSLVEFKEP